LGGPPPVSVRPRSRSCRGLAIERRSPLLPREIAPCCRFSSCGPRCRRVRGRVGVVGSAGRLQVAESCQHVRRERFRHERVAPAVKRHPSPAHFVPEHFAQYFHFPDALARQLPERQPVRPPVSLNPAHPLALLLQLPLPPNRASGSTPPPSSLRHPPTGVARPHPPGDGGPLRRQRALRRRCLSCSDSNAYRVCQPRAWNRIRGSPSFESVPKPRVLVDAIARRGWQRSRRGTTPPPKRHKP
jgi:hypothetical protein